jgi:hypothetical protein
MSSTKRSVLYKEHMQSPVLINNNDEKMERSNNMMMSSLSKLNKTINLTLEDTIKDIRGIIETQQETFDSTMEKMSLKSEEINTSIEKIIDSKLERISFELLNITAKFNMMEGIFDTVKICLNHQKVLNSKIDDVINKLKEFDTEEPEDENTEGSEIVDDSVQSEEEITTDED